MLRGQNRDKYRIIIKRKNPWEIGINLNVQTFNNGDDDDFDDNDDDYLLNAALMEKNGLPFVLLDPLSVIHRKLKSDIMDLLHCVCHCHPPTRWARCLGLQRTLMFFGVTHCEVAGKVTFASLPVDGGRKTNLGFVFQSNGFWKSLSRSRADSWPAALWSLVQASKGFCRQVKSYRCRLQCCQTLLFRRCITPVSRLVTHSATFSASLGDFLQIRMWNRQGRSSDLLSDYRAGFIFQMWLFKLRPCYSGT